MPAEPLGNDFRSGNAGDFIAHAENRETQTCQNHLHVVAEKRSAAEVGGKGIPFDECAREHQAARQQTGEAHTAFVENDAAEKEHQQKHVDETVGAGEESVLAARPAQTALFGHFGKHIFKGRHDVAQEVARHHGKRHNHHSRPSRHSAVAQFFSQNFSHLFLFDNIIFQWVSVPAAQRFPHDAYAGTYRQAAPAPPNKQHRAARGRAPAWQGCS